MNATSDEALLDDSMNLDPSYLLAVIKASSVAIADKATAPVPLCSSLILDHEFRMQPRQPGQLPTISHPTPSMRRRRATSDLTGLDAPQLKRLRLLRPIRPRSLPPTVTRIPHWQPPVFNYSIFNHRDYAHKILKRTVDHARQDLLDWVTSFLDLDIEAQLLSIHRRWALQQTVEVAARGGFSGEKIFLRKLRGELSADLTEVIRDMLKNNDGHGVDDSEMHWVLEFVDFVGELREERDRDAIEEAW